MGDDRASVLMLMPAAVLIVLLLGAIAVDSAIVYLGQRQAQNVAFDAANDVAGAGFDATIARTTGEFVYADEGRLTAIAQESVEAAAVDDLRLVSVVVTADGEIAVTVTITIDRLFGQAFGAASDETITTSATATGEVATP